LRRDFHDLWVGSKSQIAREALDRIGAIYDIEGQITGQSAQVRLAARQTQSKPKVEAFNAWAQPSSRSSPAKAFANAFDTRSHAGRPSACSLKMAALLSTTIPLKEPSNPLESAGKTGCSLVRIPAPKPWRVP
jgi:hypothetical protein